MTKAEKMLIGFGLIPLLISAAAIFLQEKKPRTIHTDEPSPLIVNGQAFKRVCVVNIADGEIVLYVFTIGTRPVIGRYTEDLYKKHCTL